MKIVTGLVLASAFALVSQTLGSGVRVSKLRSAFGPSTAQAAESPDAHAVLPRPAEGRAGQAGSVPAGATAGSVQVLDLDPPEDRFIRVGPLNRRVLIPKHLCRTDAKHDVLVHFHGVPTSVEPSVDRSGLDAVVVIVNWGIGSGPYEDYFKPRGALTSFVAWIERSVDRACGLTTSGTRRLGLSSWSAGYGAIYRILLHSEDRARVDALLMSDGLHVGYVGPGQVNPASMQVFADFAHQAAAGEKLFAITHSDISPERYASTRETADYLIQHEKAVLKLVDEQGPRPKMRLTSRAVQGDFHVLGFAGTVAADHAQHLHALGTTLFPLLRERWARIDQ